jgi:hypothetical protein
MLLEEMPSIQHAGPQASHTMDALKSWVPCRSTAQAHVQLATHLRFYNREIQPLSLAVNRKSNVQGHALALSEANMMLAEASLIIFLRPHRAKGREVV